MTAFRSCEAEPEGVVSSEDGYVPLMTTTPNNPDQDAEPPTPDGTPPDIGDSNETGSHPDPSPGVCGA
jgi:hypothetical protein